MAFGGGDGVRYPPPVRRVEDEPFADVRCRKKKSTAPDRINFFLRRRLLLLYILLLILCCCPHPSHVRPCLRAFRGRCAAFLRGCTARAVRLQPAEHLLSCPLVYCCCCCCSVRNGAEA